MSGESRSFHYCGLFSNIQEQLCVQFVDVVTSKLVAVTTPRREGPPCLFPAVFRLRPVSRRHCASADGVGPSQLPAVERCLGGSACQGGDGSRCL